MEESLVRKNSILYIGGSFAQIAGIECAKQAGLYVAVADRSVAAPARMISDRFEVIAGDDHSSLLQYAEELNEQLGLACCYGMADLAYQSIGIIYEQLGINICNKEIYRVMADKSMTRMVLSENNVPIPVGRSVDLSNNSSVDLVVRDLSDMPFPLVVKPAEIDSSQAVVTACNKSELNAAIKYAGNLCHKVVVEEYVHGKHFNVDIVIIDGEVFPMSITEREFLDHIYHQPLYGIQLSNNNTEHADLLFSVLEDACSALNFKNGPVTADIILTVNGPKILEISPHVHSVTVSRLLGNDSVLGGWFSYTAGCENWRRYMPSLEINGCAAYYYAYSDKSGEVISITGLDSIKDNEMITNIDLRVSVGDVINVLGNYKKLCAIITLKSDNRASLEKLIEELPERLTWKVQSIS
jgi:phosphoribosylaminoimidazole carboxylase (NCAIR synthetase)